MRSVSVRFLAGIVMCISLGAGCVATQAKLMKLNLSMTKSEVRSAIGDPAVARGTITNRYGQVIEVWE